MNTRKYVCSVLASLLMLLTDVSYAIVAYYPFNGYAYDQSGKGNHGIVHGINYRMGIH